MDIASIKTEIEQYIQQGVQQGLIEKDLRAKLQEFTTQAKNNGQNDEEMVLWLRLRIKRHIKSLLLTPMAHFDAVVLGTRSTDWGAIMKRKYGDVYPDGDKRAGQKIPDHDITTDVLVYRHDKNVIEKLSVRGLSATILKFVPGGKYKMRVQQGYKEGMLLWNETLSTVELVGNEDMRTFIPKNLGSYIVPSLSKLDGAENGLKIIMGDVIQIDERFGDMQVSIMDDSVGIDDKTVNVRLGADKVNFADSATGVIFVADLIKNSDAGIDMMGYGAFCKTTDVVEKRDIEDDGSSAEEQAAKFI